MFGLEVPRLSVIIVNYNSGDRLGRCLQCLEVQTFRDFETIVIDNASSDSSAMRAREDFRAFRFIDADANLGFAAANNRAAADAGGEWLVFLNPDAYPYPDWLQELVSASARYPWADAFGSTQIMAAEPAKLDGAGDVFHLAGIPYRGHFGWPIEKLPPDGECFSVCAAAAMYRKSAFENLGGFDEHFFCYGEDVDLGFRLRLVGGRAVQVSAARVLHEGSGVTGRRSEFTIRHGHRNRVWTAFKNMPAPLYWGGLPFRFFADLVLLFRYSMMGRGGVYLGALKDGYGGLYSLCAARRIIQSQRKVRVRELARFIEWSPLKLLRRQASLKPLKGPGA